MQKLKKKSSLFARITIDFMVQSHAKSLSKDVSSDETYIVLKSEKQDGKREVLFRFGSWCYAGRVKLVPKIMASDVPLVLSAIRSLRKNLDYLDHVDSLSACSPFAPALGYAAKIQNVMESQVAGSEDYLKMLLENGQTWLDQNESESFFEFACVDDGDLGLRNVEMIVTKANRSSGLVTVSIFFDGNWFLSLGDSIIQCPTLSKERGYNIQFYPNGIREWPRLRYLNLWSPAIHHDSSSEPLMADFAGENVSDCVDADTVMPQVCDGHGDDDIAMSEQDRLEISHLEESLDEIESDFSQDDDYRDEEWNIDEEHRHHEKPAATVINPITVAPQECFDTSDIFAAFEKFDQRLDQELRELKEWEK